MRLFYDMNLELRIWIWPGFSVSVCGCVGWVCGGVVWERIGCRWLHAFLPQQEGEQAPVIYAPTPCNDAMHHAMHGAACP